MLKLKYIWNLPRSMKRLISLFIDSTFIVASYYAAHWARLGDLMSLPQYDNEQVLLGTLVITLFAFTKLGLYRAILRYLTFHALYVVSIGTIISSVSVGLLAYYLNSDVPRSVPIIYGAFLALSCGGVRLIARVLVSQSYSKGRKNVLIYGAGSAGRQLALALRSSETHKVIGFIDQDKTLENTVLMGLKVLKIEQTEKSIDRANVEQILLAIPSASRSRRKEILDELVHLSAEVLTIPDMGDIVSGKAKIDELKDVAIEDLLGRDPVEPQQSLMEANIKDKNVMVTGAGGSIGSELCRQIIKQQPKSIVLYEISEFALYQIDRELQHIVKKEKFNTKIYPLLGSVQNQERLTSVLKTFNVKTVYHAAAYKHVPLVEYNIVEGVQNNVFGTYITACSAISAKVDSFVLISTDKAVRPTNVMGASKRLAELSLQALATQKDCETIFSMVRFGNVLGSSGSVIPLFKKQIASGGPITVTDPQIVRYFMTIPEAAQLVIQAGAMSTGGDVFVLDMGEPVKIVNLAKNLVNLSGLEIKDDNNPLGDIAIEYSGLRPGEKLFEELLISEKVQQTSHKRILTANEISISLADFKIIYTKLEEASISLNSIKINELLKVAPLEYNPSDEPSDLVQNNN
ncbi:polysaccharide biosynthesis protein [Vibrio breoganii]|uniref:polysaccharide biosynthesis protein n=1 Tax=Vibrio breoganii TaxID=553239 RepID=UPI0021C49810|nr:nucleoside-diphosphate sugar epimerase/dehydratase [Vibrio breoganii]MDN3715923.1 nucleoside-diphosphate sugar epimerase/dehydratase [Vibrio breoganii]